MDQIVNFFVNATEIISFKSRDFNIKTTPLCQGNILKYFFVDNMKKTELNGYVYDFMLIMMLL